MDAPSNSSQAAANSASSTRPGHLVAGVLARFVFTPESVAAAPAFFEAGLAIVQAQPASTIWIAFRVDETTFGAFAAFASADDRAALLASGGPKLADQEHALFAEPPTFDKVDILASRG